MVNESKRRRLKDFLNRTECRDATHSTGVVFVRGEGSLLYDVEGREYVDLCAGFGTLPFGHRKWNTQTSLAAGMGDVYATLPKVRLLATLRKMMPVYLSRIALTVTGSQAVELALKTAFLATGQSGVIAIEGGYHGLDFGTLPLTSLRKFREPFASWIVEHNVAHVPIGCEMDVLAECVHRQRETGTAAIIVEPVQGRGGVNICADSWLLAVKDFCRQHKILLVFDEIFTGLGRTGTLTKSEIVNCDLICLGKSLGSGMPISAVLGREEVMNAWPRNTGEALHTGTFFGHPLSCAIATKTLRAITEFDLCQRAKFLGIEALSYLRKHLNACANVRDVRGEGLMLALEFSAPQAGATIARKLRQQGVIAIPCGEHGQCLSITPALTIPRRTLRKALAVVVDAVA